MKCLWACAVHRRIADGDHDEALAGARAFGSWRKDPICQPQSDASSREQWLSDRTIRYLSVGEMVEDLTLRSRHQTRLLACMTTDYWFQSNSCPDRAVPSLGSGSANEDEETMVRPRVNTSPGLERAETASMNAAANRQLSIPGKS